MNKQNVHVLPTDKPSPLMIEDSKLIYSKNFGFNEFDEAKNFKHINKQHIYITSSEEIKQGDYYLYLNQIGKRIRKNTKAEYPYPNYQKIILTTDQDLINDGVQAINDEFLEWFVKNPSCENVEVLFNNRGISGAEKILKIFGEYKIIIPKKELSKDEIDKFFVDMVCRPKQEAMYGESEMIEFVEWCAKNYVPTITSQELKHWQKGTYQNKDHYYSTKELLELWKEQQVKTTQDESKN